MDQTENIAELVSYTLWGLPGQLVSLPAKQENLLETSVITCTSCNLRWPTLLKVSVEFRGLQAQITSLSQHVWRNGLAYQQLHGQWQQNCLRVTEANARLDEAKEALQAQEIRHALQTQELSITKDSLSHEFRLLEDSEEKLKLQRNTIQKMVVILNKLVSPDELTKRYGVWLPDDLGLGTLLQTHHDLEHQGGVSRNKIEDLERQLQEKQIQISKLQQENEDTSSRLQNQESESAALRQELSQYCSDEDVEFGTAMLGKRQRLQ